MLSDDVLYSNDGMIGFKKSLLFKTLTVHYTHQVPSPVLVESASVIWCLPKPHIIPSLPQLPFPNATTSAYYSEIVAIEHTQPYI